MTLRYAVSSMCQSVESEQRVLQKLQSMLLAEELAVDKEDILDFELNTYCMEEPAYVGIRDTFLSSPRLDNQTSVAALLQALMQGERVDGINLIALFDHEEIGNTSKQGAATNWMEASLRWQTFIRQRSVHWQK